MELFNTDFHQKGFQILDGSQFVESLYIPSLPENVVPHLDVIKIKFQNGKNPVVETKMTDCEYEIPKMEIDLLGASLYDIHVQLEKLVENASINRRRFWFGTNPDAYDWHNDLHWHQSERKDPSFFFLLYLSTPKYEDGAIRFRNGEEEWRFLPKSGLMFLVNCKESRFEHCVEKGRSYRAAASFDFVWK